MTKSKTKKKSEKGVLGRMAEALESQRGNEKTSIDVLVMRVDKELLEEYIDKVYKNNKTSVCVFFNSHLVRPTIQKDDKDKGKTKKE